MTGKIGGSAKHQYDVDRKEIPQALRSAKALSKRVQKIITDGLERRKSQGDPKLQKKIDDLLRKTEALEKRRAAAETFLKRGKDKHLKDLKDLIPIEEDKDDAKGTPEEKKVAKLYESAIKKFLSRWRQSYESISELSYTVGTELDIVEDELKRIKNQSK